MTDLSACQLTDSPAYRLRQERESAGLGQARVGAICGVSSRTVARWEAGTPIPADHLATLMEAGFDGLYVLTGRRPGDPYYAKITPNERYLLDRWRNLSKESRKTIDGMIDALLQRDVQAGASPIRKVAERSAQYRTNEEG